MSKIDRLHSIISKSNGPLSRSFLIETRKNLKQGRQSALDGGLSARQPTGDVPANSDELVTRGPISLIALSLRGKSVSRLLKGRMDAALPACMKIGDQVAEDAMMVIEGRVGDLVAFAAKTPIWRFKGYQQLYLRTPPEFSNITDLDGIAVCQRGNVVASDFTDWARNDDVATMAEGFFRETTGRRVHLLAEKVREGWETIIGDANWIAL